MNSRAFDPPLHLRTDRDGAIHSLEQAAQLVRAHVLAHADSDAAWLLGRIERLGPPIAA
jgi:hypothetical protein